jgi:caa(3)-type oxidase subunit IV
MAEKGEKPTTKADKVEQKPAEAEKAAAHGETHGHGAAEAHGAHGAHGTHKVDRRQYFVIFGVLFVLTVLEVAVAKVPGISRTLVGLALVGMAVTKAACVGLYYMHLNHETKVLKLTVAIPMATPAVYALVLISEAAWRLTRW